MNHMVMFYILQLSLGVVYHPLHENLTCRQSFCAAILRTATRWQQRQQPRDKKRREEILTYCTEHLTFLICSQCKFCLSLCRSTAGVGPCPCPGDTPPCLQCLVQVSTPAPDSWTGRCPGLNLLQLPGVLCSWSTKASAQKMSKVRRAAVPSPVCTGGLCRRTSRWLTAHRSDQRSPFHTAADTPWPALFPGISPLTLSIPKHTESAGGCREVWWCHRPFTEFWVWTCRNGTLEMSYAGLMDSVRDVEFDYTEPEVFMMISTQQKWKRTN